MARSSNYLGFRVGRPLLSYLVGAVLNHAVMTSIDGTGSHHNKPSNEYVLNVAFLSFLIFTALQFFFALIAKSSSMMVDCAAMTVDVVSYFVNVIAERLKDARNERTVLYLELFPPTFSVVTLVIVTSVALHQAISTLSRKTASSDDPNVRLMLVFSALNLVLDILNMGCFARVDFQPLAGTSNGDRTVSMGDAPKEHTKLLPRNDFYEEDSEIRNLNMCSAWTHVSADTLRSVAVLLAAGIATLFPDDVSPTLADSNATIVVSLIILISLGPLLHGLLRTLCQIVRMERAIRAMDLV